MRFKYFLASCILAAAQLAPSAAAAASGVPDTIEQRVAACIACHGREGATTNAGHLPPIAGKPAGYLYNQLIGFRDGRRFNADMTYMVRNLSNAYLREMAEYFAALDLPDPDVVTTTYATSDALQRGKTLALDGDLARKIPACTQCHGDRLTGIQPGTPALLGLPRIYLAVQLNAWRSGERHALVPDCMAEVAEKLSATDVNAVASWLALQPMPPHPKPLAVAPHPLPLRCGSMPR